MCYRLLSRRDAIGLLGVAGGGMLWGCTRMDQKNSIPPLPHDVGGCTIDAKRLAPLGPCMICSGPTSPRDEWNHSCIHPRTVAYSCGRLAYPGGPNEHDHEAAEITRCKALATEAGQMIAGVSLNLSEAESTLEPFFVSANRGQTGSELSPDYIRSSLGGVVYPAAKIVVEPLVEDGVCWQHFAASPDASERLSPSQRESLKATLEEGRRLDEARIERWRKFIRWFQSKEELLNGSFVMIGDRSLSDTNFACVFPRLVLGITRSGSLVGVCGHAVHT